MPSEKMAVQGGESSRFQIARGSGRRTFAPGRAVGRFMAGNTTDRPWMDETDCLTQRIRSEAATLLISRGAFRLWPV